MLQSPYLLVSTTAPNVGGAVVDPIVDAPFLTSGHVGPWTISPLDHLIVKFDGIETDDIYFTGHKGIMTTDQVCAVLNAGMHRGKATNDGNEAIVITSYETGAAASVETPGGDTLCVIFDFPVGVPAVGDPSVAFRFDIPSSSEIVFSCINEDLDPESAILVDLVLYGLCPDGHWHKFEEVTIDEDGICDFYVIPRTDYSWIYVQDVSTNLAATEVMLSLMNSNIALPVSSITTKRGS